MTWQVINGSNIEVLKTYPDNHFDSIVTDPPYGIAFLGKDWDSRKATETTTKLTPLSNLPSGMKHTSLADDLAFQDWMAETFAECIRVLKPGGYLLAFSAARTYHHMAMAAQRAGFEIRDQIMWIYSSGFPKSQDVGKTIDRAAGKADPNYTGSKKKGHNLAYGSAPVGGRPCGKCGKDDTHQYICEDTECGLKYKPQTEEGKKWSGWGTALKPAHEPICMARKPISEKNIALNCQTWGTGAIAIDAGRVGEFVPSQPSTGTNVIHRELEGTEELNATSGIPDTIGRFPSNVLGEIAEPYQKYFYCPKVSRAERHLGHTDIPEPEPFNNPEEMRNHPLWDPSIGTNSHRLMTKIREHNRMGNNHPTVKPIALMEYLIRLVTRPGGHVLDPFNGSGSTGCAAVKNGYDYTGIELDPAYVEISQKRIATQATHFNTLFEEKK